MSSVCSYCKSSAIPGIHFPSDFSDREDCRDGQVFIAKCDECDKYDCDMAAAEVVSKILQKPIHKSYDCEDDAGKLNNKEAFEKGWFRPYFRVTLKEAEAVNDSKEAA